MIQLKNVHKNFEGKPVLRGLNLEIYDGEIITIIGASGAGKSVLFKNIVGLMKPDSGEIIVDGVDITKLDEDELHKVQTKFGMLFQGAALFDSLNVYENVAFGLRRLTNMNEVQIKRKVAELLEVVNLSGTQNLPVSALSGGMKKRVGLARALATSPKYLLYDEPTTGLDPILADSINKLIVKVNKQLKVTSIVVTHDMKSGFEISHRIAFLSDGVIKETGTPDEIKNSKLEELRKFISLYFQ
ncbi:MAG: ATP-binding cassette domain-containing protein [Elusimicrobia bacterium]|nr:ATP-binding cassette domain-containing protein [Elusimicrobiota bacterium]